MSYTNIASRREFIAGVAVMGCAIAGCTETQTGHAETGSSTVTPSPLPTPESHGEGEALVLVGNGLAVAGGVLGLIPEVSILGKVIALAGAIATTSGNALKYTQGQVLREAVPGLALPIRHESPVEQLPVQQADGGVQIATSTVLQYVTPIVKIKGRRRSIQVQFDNNFHQWAKVRDPKSGKYHNITLNWLTWLIQDAYGEYVVTEDCKPHECETCGLQLSSLKVGVGPTERSFNLYLPDSNNEENIRQHGKCHDYVLFQDSLPPDDAAPGPLHFKPWLHTGQGDGVSSTQSDKK